MKRRQNKMNPLVKMLLWGVLIVVAGVGAAGVYGYYWMQGYLKSPAFRGMVARQVGQAAKADATIDEWSWTGPNVFVPRAGLTPKAGQSWKLIEGEGLQASVDFQAARRGLWQVTRISLDRLTMNMRAVEDIPQTLPPEAVAVETAPPSMPGWLRRWLPTRTQIDVVDVETFDLVPADASGVRVEGLKLQAKPAVDEGAWLIRSGEGKLTLPGVAEPFRLSSGNIRLDTRALAVNNATAQWIGDCEVTAHGDVPFETGRTWGFSGHLAGLDLKHVLGPDWLTKLSGVLDGDYEATPGKLKARLKVSNGVVHNVPLLGLVADFTRTERFRRVVLDQATADVERTGDTTFIRKLVLQSNGLVRVEGDVTIQGQALNGSLLVGVLPESLRWIPGTQSRVFTEAHPTGPPGFVWAKVQLSGTTGSIKEDLSNRLLLAMGREILETPLDLTGKTLDVLGQTSPANAQDAIKAGTTIMQGTGEAAGKAVETGVEVLKGVVPLFGK